MAVVREDTVKVVFDVDDKPLEKVDSGIDKLVQNTQKMAGSGGIGKLTQGLNSLADAAKKLAGTKLTAIQKGLTDTKNKLTGGEKGAKGLFNVMKKVAKVSFKATIKGVWNLTKGIGKALAAAGKLTLKLGSLGLQGLTAGIGAGIAGITALGTAAITAYGEYEQLVGGVDTLFKGSSKEVQKYANNAYKTAGLSANEYMSTVTSFSASLLQSVGGDTAKAAKLADQAIIDMSDNANKMGTDMGSIQDAYQGFAKQNYTMLDNLKLGYGGTKEEMQRLLNDAEKLSGQKFDISSYADIVSAIHVVQNEMGITGTTAKEASSTIQGSFSSMKSAWTNFVTGLANEDADIDQLIGNLIDSVVTFGDNLIPRIQILLPRLVQGLTQLGQSIAGALPGIISSVLPALLDGAISLVDALVSTLEGNAEQVANTATTIIMKLAQFFLQSLPQIIVVGMKILSSVITGIAQQLPQLIPIAIQAIYTIGQGLINNLPTILQAGIQILLALINGITQMLPMLIQMAVTLIIQLAQGIIANLPTILQAGINLLLTLALGIIEALPQLIGMIPQLFMQLVQGIFSIDWLQVGWELIKGIFSGIWNGAKSLFSGIWDGIKSLFTGGGKSAGEATGDSLTSGLQTSSTAATAELSTFATSTTQYGTQAATNLASGLTANAGQITTAASTTMTDTNTVMQTGMNSVVQTVNQTDLKPSGVDMMQGLNQGMKSQIPALVATAKEAAASVKKATDVELKIHSPSRVMEESGEYAGLGQIQGLRNTIPDMQVAARDVSNASIPYESYSPDSGTIYNSKESSYTTVSPVFNLTVSGTQDDRATARRVKRYVAEAIKDTFESLERKSYSLREA